MAIDYVQRRHIGAFLASTICFIGVKQYLKKKILKRRINLAKLAKRLRSGNVGRDREAALKEIDQLPEYVFKAIFRVSRDVFDQILNKISAHLPSNPDLDHVVNNVEGKKGQTLPTKVKLLATLRYMAGGMKWDICLALKIGFGSFFQENKYGVVWPILDAIDQSYSIGINLNDEEDLRKKAQDFADIHPNSAAYFKGCILAIDGLVMHTRQPYKRETDNVMSYRNR